MYILWVVFFVIFSAEFDGSSILQNYVSRPFFCLFSKHVYYWIEPSHDYNRLYRLVGKVNAIVYFVIRLSILLHEKYTTILIQAIYSIPSNWQNLVPVIYPVVFAYHNWIPNNYWAKVIICMVYLLNFNRPMIV